MRLPEKFIGAGPALHEAASAACGLHDFGETSYLEGLEVLLDSLERDLPRDHAAREACFAAIIAPLTARLYAQAGWTRDPGCLTGRLKRPVFVVGAPRTGTTALHQLLAAAPGWQGLENWLAKRPMTRPPRAAWDSVKEYREVVATSATRIAATPQLRSIHFVEPHEYDECIHLTSQTMTSQMFGSGMHVPSYDTWFYKQDCRPVLRWVHDNLRLIGADEPDTRWLLKNPYHVLNLEELLELFEDSVVIYTHRDPLKAQPSFWNLISLHHQARDGANFNPYALAERAMDSLQDALVRNIAIAARHPTRILEVFEDDMVADPLGFAQRIFAFVDEPLGAEAEKGMRDWVAANPKGKHGAHRYAAQDFGVEPAEIAERFAQYRRHYGFDARVTVTA